MNSNCEKYITASVIKVTKKILRYYVYEPENTLIVVVESAYVKEIPNFLLN